MAWWGRRWSICVSFENVWIQNQPRDRSISEHLLGSFGELLEGKLTSLQVSTTMLCSIHFLWMWIWNVCNISYSLNLFSVHILFFSRKFEYICYIRSALVCFSICFWQVWSWVSMEHKVFCLFILISWCFWEIFSESNLEGIVKWDHFCFLYTECKFACVWNLKSFSSFPYCLGLRFLLEMQMWIEFVFLSVILLKLMWNWVPL
mgnify:CR=1 FL=1